MLALVQPSLTMAELGIGVDVIATSDDTPGQLATNRQLWFSTTPGGVVSRQLRVISSSDDEQQISLGIYPLVVVDGEPTIDTTEASETAVWATIEPNNFVLAPRTTETITITYRPPSDVQVGSYEAYVQILVKAVSIDAPQGQGGLRAVVPTALSFKKSLWLGIGDQDGELPVTDFELDGVAGYLRDGKNVVQIRISNTGETPIRPKGDIEFVDPLFPDNRFGPVDFSSPTIMPGESARTEIDAPDGLTDGAWKVRVTARQGSIQKSEVFDVELTFDDSTSEFAGGWGRLLALPWMRIVVALVALVGLWFGLRMLRGGTKRDTGDDSDDDPTGGEPDQPKPTTPSRSSPTRADLDATTTSSTTEPAAPSRESRQSEGHRSASRVVVQVSGMVNSPGVFQVDADARVAEVLELAGGLLILADTTSLNLARRVVDGEQIVVPKRQPRGASEVTGTAVPEILDLNLATAEQLAALPGLSLEIAREIVAHRRRISAFRSVDELLKIRGIGPRKLAGIRKRLRV
ncbi:MAG: ComEA family DNA-binding protein [Actinobacteria bacterium]|jgi:competence protein ComEA|nr:ComEA family DNA-binding protein [Actinomycetota bacterium]